MIFSSQFFWTVLLEPLKRVLLKHHKEFLSQDFFFLFFFPPTIISRIFFKISWKIFRIFSRRSTFYSAKKSFQDLLKCFFWHLSWRYLKNYFSSVFFFKKLFHKLRRFHRKHRWRIYWRKPGSNLKKT